MHRLDAPLGCEPLLLKIYQQISMLTPKHRKLLESGELTERLAYLAIIIFDLYSATLGADDSRPDSNIKLMARDRLDPDVVPLK